MLERDEVESYNSCQLAPFTFYNSHFIGELQVVIVVIVEEVAID